MLFRFQLNVSDIDRDFYDTLDFRAARHPSETSPYLLTRAIAFALNYSRNLEFSPSGLGDPDQPAIRRLSDNGINELFIEIGNPSARRLHKASKTAKQVLVFTYKNPELLLSEIRGGEVHRAEEIKIFALDAGFLDELESHLQKNNVWTLLHQDSRLDVSGDGWSASTDIKTYSAGPF